MYKSSGLFKYESSSKHFKLVEFTNDSLQEGYFVACFIFSSSNALVVSSGVHFRQRKQCCGFDRVSHEGSYHGRSK